MFPVSISNVDAFGQGRCDRNVFDLDFPLWFYALVGVAGLLLLPWFYLIGCIVFKIISKAASSLNLNRMHGHHSATWTTLDWNSWTHLIQQRNPVRTEHEQHSVCSEFNSD